MSAKRIAIGALLSCLLCACNDPAPDISAKASQPQPPAISAPEPAPPSQPVRPVILSTGKPILSMAAIPSTAHRGLSLIAVAHGQEGVSVLDTTGRQVAVIETPARLVAHYQGRLVIYSLDEAGQSTLRRYRVNDAGQYDLVETSSPSPIAATTLQRTAIASLGPAQISGTDLIVGERTYSAPNEITAVAAASYFPPIIAGQTLLMATADGQIYIQAVTD